MLNRMLKVLVGIVLAVAGAFLGLVPGAPGFPLVFLGVGLVLAQSEPGRRVIKRVRLRARDRFGSDRVRRMEARFPQEVVGPQDTEQLRIDLAEYERIRRRRSQERARREDTDG